MSPQQQVEQELASLHQAVEFALTEAKKMGMEQDEKHSVLGRAPAMDLQSQESLNDIPLGLNAPCHKVT